MNFLIVGDALRDLKPRSDSSLEMVREALMRTHTVHWCTQEDLFLWDGRVHARVTNLTECPEHSFPAAENLADPQPLNSYDSIWIRKDPPVDQAYTAMCHLLALEEKNVPMLNKPSVLLRYHEKLLPMEAVEAGFLTQEEVIPTFLPLGKRMVIPKDFPRGETVTKPLWGFAGKEVKLLPSAQTPEPYFLLQPFQKKIHDTGDRRVFILDGEVAGSFVRLPAAGDIRANLAVGGRAEMRVMTKKEQALTERVGNFLKEVGISFAGVDLIQEKISEINITSPTGLITFRSLGGPRLVSRYLDLVESLV